MILKKRRSENVLLDAHAPICVFLFLRRKEKGKQKAE
jgi:hypothetical protein